MHSSPFRRWIAAGVLLGLAAAALLLGKYLSTKGIAWAGNFGSIAAFFLATLTFVGPLASRWLGRIPPLPAVNVRQAADDLAKALDQQWTDEEQVRRINDPRPLPVRWKVTPLAADAMLSPAPIGTPDTAAPTLISFAGEYSQAIDLFSDVPSHRLVILGSPGAGKTVLAAKLARELLARRRSDGLVPIVLSVAAWNPEQEMADWIADQLVQSHPGLGERVKPATGETTTLARALVSGNIFPILDGLDELPAKLRGKAIVQINAAGSHLPLILTSRPEEYLDAIREVGRAVSRATAIQLLPLRIPEVKSYLREATSAFPDQRWRRVFDRLDSDPDSPLAATLTNPLMLWLARTIYETATIDPSELIEESRFKTQESLEEHLLDALIPAVYSKSRTSRRRWTSRRARRWLGFLAAELDYPRLKARRDIGRSDIGWWRLGGSLRLFWPLITAIRVAVISATLWQLATWILTPLWKPSSANLKYPLMQILLDGPMGHRLQPRIIQAVHAIGPQSIPRLESALSSLDAVVSLGSFESFVVKVSLFTAFASWFGSIHWRKTRPSRFKVSFVPSFAFLAFDAIFLALLLENRAHTPESDQGIVWASIGVCVSLIAVSLSEKFARQIDIYGTISPSRALHLDRVSAIIIGIITDVQLIALSWLVGGTRIAVASGIFLTVVLLCSVLFGGRRTSASSLFQDSRILLTGLGRAPWRTMAFLSDAHRRGVLRQVGATYRFRHARLQERLSVEHTDWTPHLNTLATRAVSLFYALQFKRLAHCLPPQTLGGHVTELTYEGVGLTQVFTGRAPESEWIMCATPWHKPVLVAKSVWNALEGVTGGGANASALTMVGFPLAQTGAQCRQRIISSDTTEVNLAHGHWGAGRLVRERPASAWRWEPVLRVVNDKLDRVVGHRFMISVGHAPITVRATIPWQLSDLMIGQNAIANLIESLPRTNMVKAIIALGASRGVRLTPTVHKDSVPLEPVHYTVLTISFVDLKERVLGTVRMKFNPLVINVAFARVAVEVNLEALAEEFQAPDSSKESSVARDTQITSNELNNTFCAAWQMATEIMPCAFVEDPVRTPPAGAPIIEFIMHNSSARGSGAELGDIVFTSGKSQRTLKLAFTGPLQLDEDRRQEFTRWATFRMLRPRVSEILEPDRF